MDTVMATKRKNEEMVLTCEKQRDAIPFGPLRLALVHEYGSVVLRRSQSGPPRGSDEKLNESERSVFDALLVGYDGSGLPATDWMKRSKKSSSTFYRARKKLVQLSLVKQDGRLYQPTTCDDSLPTPK